MAGEAKELLVTEGAVVTREDGFIRVRRRAVPPLRDVAELEVFAGQLARAVPQRERQKLGLLLDMRDGPLGTDDALMIRMEPAIQQLYEGFSRVAVLVGTAVGKLQANRRAREAGMKNGIFDNEAAAIAYVRGQDAPARRR